MGSKATTETDKPSSKRTLNFGEEESARKKLEKLPTLPLEDVDAKGDADQANGVDDDDDDVDMQDAGTEEETAAAARAAHEKREERLQNQNLVLQADENLDKDGIGTVQTNGDVDMKEAEENQAKPEPAKEQEEEEDIDALDAFMSGLSDVATSRKGQGPGLPQGAKSKSAQQQPEALFGDEDVDLDAVEGDPGDILAMASKARKKKDLPVVNHSKMKYEPYRKSFYTEPSELAMMTDEEVADLRLELDGIKVRVCMEERSLLLENLC